MSIAHLLEDFGAYASGKPLSMTDVSLEEYRLEAFEKGYQAGWDDSAKAQSDTVSHVSADLAQNLQELSFTYQEAYSAVLAALRPLLEQTVQQVLPKLAHQSLGAQVVEQLNDLACGHGRLPVEIVAAPTNLAVLETLSEKELPMPVSVIAEPTLADGQVYLRFADKEREVDLGAVLSAIGSAIDGFFEEQLKETG